MNNALYPNAMNANRKGRLTLLQAIGLSGWVLFGAFLFLPGVAMFGWFVYGLITHTLYDIGAIVFNAIFNVGFAAVLMWFGYLVGGKLLIDILLGKVRQIEGQGMKYSGSSGRSGRNYYYSVGEQNFQIPSHGTYKNLHDANNVRAFYLPRSKTLVNLEWDSSPSGTSHGIPKEFAGDEELSELWRLEQAEKETKRQK